MAKNGCVGNVQKGMAIGFETKKNSNALLAVGKTLGGNSSLTEKQIHKVQVYYGNAVRAKKKKNQPGAGERGCVGQLYPPTLVRRETVPQAL